MPKTCDGDVSYSSAENGVECIERQTNEPTKTLTVSDDFFQSGPNFLIVRIPMQGVKQSESHSVALLRWKLYSEKSTPCMRCNVENSAVWERHSLLHVESQTLQGLCTRSFDGFMGTAKFFVLLSSNDISIIFIGPDRSDLFFFSVPF